MLKEKENTGTRHAKAMSTTYAFELERQNKAFES